jgi:hypothetical protein
MTGRNVVRRARAIIDREARRAAEGDRGKLLFRWLAAFGQAATIAVTWGLWNDRAFPPRLTALDLPSLDLAAPLLASVVLVLAAARVGLIAHTGLLVYAMLIDQTRLQPEVVSLAILMWGTLPGRAWPLIARAHLIALWCYSGLGKLVSARFVHGGARILLPGPLQDLPRSFDEVIAYGLAAFEIAVGLAVLVPRARRVAALGVLLLHSSILASLVPAGRNEAVWPWNGVLAFAGFAFIAGWQKSPLRSLRAARWPARVAAAVLLLAPAGFYVGAMDAYLAHQLYTFNVPTTIVCDRTQCITGAETRATFIAFHVPMPPERRLFRAYFQATCSPGDRMVVLDMRSWARWRGHDRVEVSCAPT